MSVGSSRCAAVPLWWPGQLVVRVRASRLWREQEVTNDYRIKIRHPERRRTKRVFTRKVLLSLSRRTYVRIFVGRPLVVNLALFYLPQDDEAFMRVLGDRALLE